MSYTVFFREGKEIFTATQYISGQLEEHQETLQTIINELAATGHLINSRATREANGDWWLMLKDASGDVYTYSFFISQFEQSEPSSKAEKSTQQRELVIIDAAGERDSAGGYHPGYWTVAHYASLLEAPAKQLFLQTINQILNNIPSPHYTFTNDGSIAIKIHEEVKAYPISVECRAEWR